MLTRRQFVIAGCVAAGGGIVALRTRSSATNAVDDHVADDAPADGWVALTDDDWRRRLTAEQFDVLRQSGTERPFTSALLEEHRDGVFACAGCDLDLFSSSTKFDSGTGWPSFWAPLDGAVSESRDLSLGMARTAVSCSRCEGHLGHVFDDGPQPTGLRYCMNGIALQFHPANSSGVSA